MNDQLQNLDKQGFVDAVSPQAGKARLADITATALSICRVILELEFLTLYNQKKVKFKHCHLFKNYFQLNLNHFRNFFKIFYNTYILRA